MRVALLTTAVHPDAGGPYESVAALARGLARLPGVSVSVIACSDREGSAGGPHWGDADVRLFGGPLPRRLRAALACVRAPAFLRGLDVIHGSGLWDESSVVGSCLHSRHRGPLLWSPRGMLEPWALRHHALRKRLVWHLGQGAFLKNCDVIHATSRQEAAAVRAAGLRQPVAVIPNAVSVPAEAPPRDWHARPRQCAYIGRLHPKKGLPMLLRAWAGAARAGWRLHIAGPDADGERGQLQRLAAQLGITDVVIGPPVYGADRWRLLAESQLFVCPSYSENFGIAIAEAMGAGLPVITTTGTPWDILERERGGWWVAPDVEAIRRALDEALASPPDELAALGRRCRSHVTATFGEDRVCRLMAGVYAWLLRGGPTPDAMLEADA